MIIKKKLIKYNIYFIRVKWKARTYICRENNCAFSTADGCRSFHPICDLCADIRSKYTHSDYLNFTTDDALLYYPKLC